MSWKPEIDELRRREALAEEMGGGEKLERQHSRGKLDVRERIDRLIDPDSFHEIGKIAGNAEYDEAGRLESFRASNFVFVTLPLGAAAASVEVNGGIYLRWVDGSLEVPGPIVARTPEEIQLRVP